VEWKNPQQAADWANELVDRVNARMRDRALREAQYNLDYLKGEMAATDIVGLQQAISKLLENEMQKLMLAKGNKDYSFRIVDPAQPPKVRVGPSKPLILAEGLFGGYLLLALVLIGRHFFQRSRPQHA
jgi:LPS O-antigen subunit length determinant protein (WzzB/FepE family)